MLNGKLVQREYYIKGNSCIIDVKFIHYSAAAAAKDSKGEIGLWHR